MLRRGRRHRKRRVGKAAEARMPCAVLLLRLPRLALALQPRW